MPAFKRYLRKAPSASAALLFAALLLTPFYFSCALRGLPSPVSREAAPANAPSRPEVHLLVLTDDAFRNHYAVHEDHLECYARNHGYTYRHLKRSDAQLCANVTNIYFSKHCTVSLYLETQPANTVAVVLDADVVPGAPNISLDRWVNYMIDNEVDVAFYERTWNFEITAGNYIARNTPLARGFLKMWALFEKVIPPGFSSADNGALHMAALDLLALEGRQRCWDLYQNLTAEVTNLFPYYEFVACARGMLGPAGLYPVMDAGVRKGNIAIFPRFFGFVIDAVVWGFLRHRAFYPLHHGVKDKEWEKHYVDQHEYYIKCPNYTINEYISTAELAKRIRTNNAQLLRAPMKEARVVPRWSPGWQDPTCFDKLWCAPTPFEATWASAVVGNGSETAQVQKPRIEATNRNIRWIESGTTELPEWYRRS